MGEIESLKLIEKVEEFINTLKEDIKIGIAYNLFLKSNQSRMISYKTFQRAIQELAERELIKVKKIIGGEYGTTTLILK